MVFFYVWHILLLVIALLCFIGLIIVGSEARLAMFLMFLLFFLLGVGDLQKLRVIKVEETYAIIDVVETSDRKLVFTTNTGEVFVLNKSSVTFTMSENNTNYIVITVTYTSNHMFFWQKFDIENGTKNYSRAEYFYTVNLGLIPSELGS